VNFIPYWETFHTHTHCMNWVIYLKFLTIENFVLIELLTLNYISTYFLNAIWLLYQLIIHACSEADFRENNFFCKFSFSFCFLVWSIRTVSSWVRTGAAQTVGWSGDTSQCERFCRMLMWHPASEQLPYKFKYRLFSPSRHTTLHFYSIFLEFMSFWCVFLVVSR
jgi:hypothetical protein